MYVTARSLMLLVLTFSTGELFAQQSAELLKNTSFTWNGKTLPSWEIGDGAGGGSVESTVRIQDGALKLSGNARTGRWKLSLIHI